MSAPGSTPGPRVIGRQEIRGSLGMGQCTELMREALIGLSCGDARQMVRPILPLLGGSVIGMMPAYHGTGKVAGVKVLSVFPKNYERGLPSHQGLMLLFDAETGAVKGILDAESLTEIRTAAASAAVTDVLARPDAKRLAILGAGVQGKAHLEALLLVRDFQEVSVWDIREEATAIYAREMGERTGMAIRTSQTVADATRDADVICTTTPSRHPILSLCDVRPGTHINAVGSCTAGARELSGDLVAAGRLFVDWMPAALVEAGDILLAIEDGLITKDHILGEVGSVLSGDAPGRVDEDDITIFEALGQAIEDLVAADFVVRSVEQH